MSEHKFKVGDKVIVNGHNAEITNATYADNIPYRVRFDNGVMGWYKESDLEPVFSVDDRVAWKDTEDNIRVGTIKKYDEGYGGWVIETQKGGIHYKKEEDIFPAGYLVDEVEATEYVADESILMDEDTQRLIEKVEEKVQERTKGYQIGAEDAMKDIQRIKQEQYDKGYKDGHQAGFDKGFILGMKTVIRNVEHFLKEIQP